LQKGDVYISVCVRARVHASVCVYVEGKKKQTNLIFSKEKDKHSTKRGGKSKLGKIPQFKSVKTLVIAW